MVPGSRIDGRPVSAGRVQHQFGGGLEVQFFLNAVAKRLDGGDGQPEVLRDLTRRIGEPYLVEFKTRATQYGPRTPEQVEASRIAHSMTRLRAQGCDSTAKREKGSCPGIHRWFADE